MPDARVRATAEPCPTIRLKWLRDGVEDYEYIQMLKAKGETSFVNSTAASVATSWRTWSKDPAALEAARMRLGEKLQQMTR